MAIFQNNILILEKKDTAFDSISFGNFLKQLININEVRQIPNPCLILDNSQVHREIDIWKICQGRIEFHFLPVYSPNLNPIENVFAFIKFFMKRLMATTMKGQLLDTFDLTWGQKIKAHQDILDYCFITAQSEIISQNLNDCYEHIKKKNLIDEHEGKDI